MSTSPPESRLDRIALGLAGAFLLVLLAGGFAFMLTLEREAEGSWRAVASAYAGIGTTAVLFCAAALLLGRVGWLRMTPPFGVRGYGVRLVLAALSGAAGGAVASLIRANASRVDSAVTEGAVLGTVVLVMLWGVARLVHRPAGAPPAAPHCSERPRLNAGR